MQDENENLALLKTLAPFAKDLDLRRRFGVVDLSRFEVGDVGGVIVLWSLLGESF